MMTEGDKELSDLRAEIDAGVLDFRNRVGRSAVIVLVVIAVGAALGYAVLEFVEWAAGDVCRPACERLK